MAEWCENELMVSGSEAEVNRFLAAAKSERAILDFERIVPPPAEYPAAAGKAKSSEDWYDWRTEHWGTKWNARRAARGGVTVRGVTATVLVRFDTPWRPPLPVISAAARRFPSLAFDLRWYERGMQVQGRYRCRGEEVLCDLEWEYFGHRGG